MACDVTFRDAFDVAFDVIDVTASDSTISVKNVHFLRTLALAALFGAKIDLPIFHSRDGHPSCAKILLSTLERLFRTQ